MWCGHQTHFFTSEEETEVLKEHFKSWFCRGSGSLTLQFPCSTAQAPLPQHLCGTSQLFQLLNPSECSVSPLNARVPWLHFVFPAHSQAKMCQKCGVQMGKLAAGRSQGQRRLGCDSVWTSPALIPQHSLRLHLWISGCVMPDPLRKRTTSKHFSPEVAGHDISNQQ